MKCVILYDTKAVEGLKTGWGFSCLVEHNMKKILFDTGGDGGILMHNMNALGIKPEEINILFLSHEHYDHVGGVGELLKHTENEMIAFIPASFSGSMKQLISEHAKLVEVHGAKEIADGVYTTGELGSWLKEQSLVLKTNKGNVVITGCSHPGLDHIIDKAREFGEVYGVIGGFHGFNRLDKLKEIKFIVPVHCTQMKAEILRMYPESAHEKIAGEWFEI